MTCATNIVPFIYVTMTQYLNHESLLVNIRLACKHASNMLLIK